tara:strand:+ start:7900 stop:8673 length:774 start_codon:yes stop_codon:yes gene_type:complete
MDKEKILQSNLLEKYAAGIASKMEEDMVHQALSLFPELRSELNQIELSLEKVATENKIKAPERIKASILQEIQNRKDSPKVTPMQYSQVIKSPINWSAMAATLIIGAAVSGVFGWLNHQNQQAEILQYQKELSILKDECENDKMLFAFTNDINTQKVSLRNDDQGFTALGYWNQNKEKGLLQTLNLPSIKENQSYQIWADVKGEMIAVGLVEKDAFVANSFVDLKYLAQAESINITIEPKGGSDKPTVSNLILSGTI